MVEAPVYCADCRTANTWARCPERDIVMVGGQIFEAAFKCLLCGSTTLKPMPKLSVFDNVANGGHIGGK